MTKWTVLVATAKPLVETLSVECVRALQPSYLRAFIEIVETDGTVCRLVSSCANCQNVYLPHWIGGEKRSRMFVFLCGLPVVERFCFDSVLELFSSLLRALGFSCRFDVVRETW